MARTLSFGVSGVEGYPVHVEVFRINGLPGLEIIGLPDASVRESRDRVNAAIINSGRQMQPRRITINLAPADTKKEGPSFDLPIAVGVMIANGELSPVPERNPEQTAMFGELSLDGSVQPINGALPMVISAREHGIDTVILPEKKAHEVACIQGMRILPVSHLTEVIRYLEGETELEPQRRSQHADDRRAGQRKNHACPRASRHPAFTELRRGPGNNAYPFHQRQSCSRQRTDGHSSFPGSPS